MTVKQAIPNFLKSVQIYNKQATYRYYKQYLRFISDYIGDIEVDLLDRDTIINMISLKKLKSPNISQTTLNKYISTAKTLFKHVTGKELDVKKLKQKTPEIQTVDKKTINKIFSYYETKKYDRIQYRNYLFFAIALDTGLRLNELLNVKISNIDFETNTIFADVTKNDLDRTVVFTPRTATLLRVYLIGFNHTNEYLFIDFRKGTMLSDTSIHSMISALKSKLRILEDFNPHAWRHTFATNFIRKGGNIVFLQKLMGHRNIKTTQRYLHLNKDDLINGYIDPYIE